MKVLLSAFSCCPGRGSEPGVGWNWVDQISRRHEVWLLTSDEYEPQMRQVNRPNLHVQFIPSFRRFSRFQKCGIPGLGWVYYYWWQWKAYRMACQLHAQVGFDLAHHATFVTFRAPSFLSLLPIPFIWGPVGGGGTPPRGLRSELGFKGRLYEGFRHACQFLPRLDPTVRLTMRRAAVIIAANRETAELIPSGFQAKLRVMLGIGMSSSETGSAIPPPARPEGFVILLVALLRPLKGAPLALKAMRKLRDSGSRAKLVIVGDGDERPRLEQMAERLGIAKQVEFVGNLPRPQVLGWMKSADVLLHPSLRDSGGLVLLEAMSQGKPVVCLDLGGPGEIVGEECGFKIRPGNPEQVATDLAAALAELEEAPGLCETKGEAGRRRVHERFDWDKRGEQMHGVYQHVAAKGGIRAQTMAFRA